MRESGAEVLAGMAKSVSAKHCICTYITRICVYSFAGDLLEFLHVYPTENVNPDWKGGPHISFRTTFPKPGLYKTWGQFQHKGRLVIADFTLEVG
jgi:hypothetical protein